MIEGAIVVAVGAAVTIGVWLFDAGPARRWLGLEKPTPYYVGGITMEWLRRDPKVAAVLPEDGARVRPTVLEERGKFEAMGLTPLRLRSGAEVRFRSYEAAGGPREGVLLLKPPESGGRAGSEG